jgi:hypothetical protein
MTASVKERVRRRREQMRAAGLRPVQIWVPDTRRPGFAAECRRQAMASAAADRSDADLVSLLDVALADLDEPSR